MFVISHTHLCLSLVHLVSQPSSQVIPPESTFINVIGFRGQQITLPMLSNDEIQRVNLHFEKETKAQELCLDLEKKHFGHGRFNLNFVQANKTWFSLNMERIFSPRTSRLYRPLIIHKFRHIHGELGTTKRYEDKTEHDPEVNKEYLKRETKKKLSLKTSKLLTYWYIRAVRVHRARIQIAGILELFTDPRCFFCGCEWGLRAEIVQNIEMILDQFLDTYPDMSRTRWDIALWQQYFQNNAGWRTLCYNCQSDIQEAHYPMLLATASEYEERIMKYLYDNEKNEKEKDQNATSMMKK